MIKKLLIKYRHVIAYLFFGVCTTAVNLVIYYLCAYGLSLSTAASTVIAWIAAVVFAFLTNKKWVFDSPSWKRNVVLPELAKFVTCRLATGALDLIIMLVTVDILGWNDLVMKLMSNILVIILNYVGSRLLVFKKGN